MAENSSTPKLKDKIKNIFRTSSSRKSNTGSSTSPRTSGTGEGAKSDAYTPLTNQVKGHHPGTQTGGARSASNAPGSAGAASSAPGSTAGAASTASAAPASSVGHGSQGPTSHSAAGDGVSSVPNEYTEPAITTDSKQLGESFDHQPWEQARDKTLAAEREAASAHLASEKAQQHLKAAGAAQTVVQSEAEKHAQALAEADAVRPAISSPDYLEKDVAATKEDVETKRLLAEEAADKLAAAEAAAAEKARLAEERKPIIDQHHRKISTLTEELDQNVKEVKAKETNKAELMELAGLAHKDLTDHTGNIEALTAELAKADQIAAEREREFITAKDAAAAIAERLATAKERRQHLEGAYLAKQKEADDAEESVDGYREETTRMKRQLDEYEEEWVHMQNVEKDYQLEAEEADRSLAALHGKHDPASRELQEAQAALAGKLKELDAAKKRAADAEARFRQLRQEADRHAARGAQASEAAHKHANKYQGLKNEAEFHGDKHVELWKEAVGHGDTGSHMATDAMHKLEAKVKSMMHSDEAPSA